MGDEYVSEAREWIRWVERVTLLMDETQILSELRRLNAQLERFKAADVPPRFREKQRLADAYAEFEVGTCTYGMVRLG